MQSTISRLKYGFFGLFLLASAASGFHTLWVVKPRQDCERKGGWWDGAERICATPIDISQITGRPIPEAARAPNAPTRRAPAQP